MSKFPVVFLGIALIFFGRGAFLCAQTTAQSSSGEKSCLWGMTNEQTTYQVPYNSSMAPLVPVRSKNDTLSTSDPALTAVSPETAISVISSNGTRYSYYFKEVIRRKKITEYQTVFEPEEIPEYRRVVNPCTGRIEQVRVGTSRSAFPTWHEKAIVRYEPTRVRVKVIIPYVEPASENGGTSLDFPTNPNNVTGNETGIFQYGGTASVRTSTTVVPPEEKKEPVPENSPAGEK